MAVQRKYLVVARSDGSVQRLKLTPALEMGFERTFKTSMSKLDEGASSTNLTNLAWYCAQAEARRNSQPIMGDAESWAADVDVIDLEQEDVRPTGEAPKDVGSPPSQSPQE